MRQRAKDLGSKIEELVATADELELVGDDRAEWHDARATDVLEPARGRRFGGICLVERDTPIEIKGCLVEQSNGADRTTPGRWYIKKEAHERLEAERGVYWLVVYERDPIAIVGQIIVPAATIGEFLEGRWYDNGRHEGDVAKLGWPTILGDVTIAEGGDNDG